jgi:hypothetical protein
MIELQHLGVKLPARVQGEDVVVETEALNLCWHCHGEQSCQCALCAAPGPNLTWEPGECGSCLGTGFLTWPTEAQ